MAKIALTQKLSVAQVPFQNITRAIMLHSNAEQKLKGFGQCVSGWLDQWEQGALVLADNENWEEIVENNDLLDHVIFLSLTADCSEKLRKWRDALQVQLNRKVTIAQSILALTELFLHRTD